MVEVWSFLLVEAVVYASGHIIGPRLVTVPFVAPKGSVFCVYHSIASRGRQLIFAAISRRGSKATKVRPRPPRSKRWLRHRGSIGGEVIRESQEVVVPVCVSADLLICGEVCSGADMILDIIFAIMKRECQKLLVMNSEWQNRTEDIFKAAGSLLEKRWQEQSSRTE
jgi:hypothetical protein